MCHYHRRSFIRSTCATALNCENHGAVHPVPSLEERAAWAGGDVLNGFVSAAGGVIGAVGRSAAETRRAMQFWSTVMAIWGRFKVTQVRANAAVARGDHDAYKRLWAFRHSHEAEVMWRLCVSMRGFYVKAGQLIALQAFVPTVIRSRLAQLQDDMPPMSVLAARTAINAELASFGKSIDDVFSSLTLDSVLGCASIAQVHFGRLHNGDEVAVKIQCPGGERKMAQDLGNFKFLAGMLSRTEFNFDLVSPVRELGLQISKEFDFVHERNAMEEIRNALHAVPGVKIPQGYAEMSTKRLLVMEYMHGVPLSRLEQEMKHVSKTRRKRFARRVLKKMAQSYGEMVLSRGFFQADSHPGNVLVTNRMADIALLDFGQTKRFSESTRLQFARFVQAIANRDPLAIEASMKTLGIEVTQMNDVPKREFPGRELTGAEMIAYTAFDTMDVPGVSNNPFSEASALKSVCVNRFPPELFFLMRTVQIIKGICNASGNTDFSITQEWAPIAKRSTKTIREKSQAFTRLARS